MEEDAKVNFEGRVNVSTGARKATSVQLGSTATEQSSKRELGQVCFASAICSCVFHSHSVHIDFDTTAHIDTHNPRSFEHVGVCMVIQLCC